MLPQKKCCPGQLPLLAPLNTLLNVSLSIIPVQNVYYYKQLTVGNFGIYDIKSGKITGFIYHEGESEKGANDICSHFKYYIDMFIDPDIKRFIIFAYNCTGQNKNHAIVRSLMALVELEQFESVVSFTWTLLCHVTDISQS